VLKTVLIIFFSVLFVSPSNQVDVDTMKAIWVERFTRFVEWPESMNDDLFRIQVIGDKQLAKVFETVFQELEIKGKSALVYSTSDYYNENFNPHLVYIAEKEQLNSVIKDVSNGPVLVITDVKDGAEKGAMIHILLKDNKIKFEINDQAMASSPLYVNYRLKQAAYRVLKASR
jgi:hypothetical protein